MKLARLLPDAGVWASGKKWPGGDILRKGRAEARWSIFVYGSSKVSHEMVLLKRPFQGQGHTENRRMGEL